MGQLVHQYLPGNGLHVYQGVIDLVILGDLAAALAENQLIRDVGREGVDFQNLVGWQSSGVIGEDLLQDDKDESFEQLCAQTQLFPCGYQEFFSRTDDNLC